MLAKVRTFWITGVLEQSLHSTAIIKLGLYEQLNASANPWSLVVQESNQPARALPPGTPISRVFDDAGGELLILGESGSGKTTLLLELARDLLERAMRDDTQPIPVVFNLSSWAWDPQSLPYWLVDELHSKYQVPRALGKAWIERNQVLPLLDGFDELAVTHRTACVKAINAYRQGGHGLVPMVVCSKLADYQAQKKQIQLRKIVTIQRLTAQQIDEYISSAERQLAPLRVAMREDPILQELATTPLMLSVLTLTYQDRPVEELVQAHSLESLRREVFTAYVQRMLTRGSVNTPYTLEQSKHWLTWMAQQMRQHGQTVFYIEQIQPDWLPEGRSRRIYQYLTLVLPGILIGGLVGFLASAISFRWSFITQIYVIVGMLIGGLICAGKISTIPAEQKVSPRTSHRDRYFSIRYLNDRLILGLGLGIFAGVVVGLNFGLGYGLAICLGSVLITIFFGQGKTVTSSKQTLEWSWRSFWQNVFSSRHLRNGFIVGGIAALGLGIDYLQTGEPLFGLGLGLGFGLVGVLLSVLFDQMTTTIQPAEILGWSWRSFLQKLISGRYLSNGLTIGLIVGLVYGLAIGLDNGLTAGLGVGIGKGFGYGLACWLLVGLFGGLSSNSLPAQRRVTPNQGIRRSARNGIVIGIISGVVCGSIGWLSFALSDALSLALSSVMSLWQYTILHYGLNEELFLTKEVLGFVLSNWMRIEPSRWLYTVLSIGLGVGLLSGLLGGGLACIQHSILRLFLWHAKSIPWNYSRFLDYAANHILLHKVGGGYIYVHNLLLDYFASLEIESPQR